MSKKNLQAQYHSWKTHGEPDFLTPDLVVFVVFWPVIKVKKINKIHPSPSKTGQIHRGISKRVQGFWREQTTMWPCFWWTKKKTHPEKWTNPTIWAVNFLLSRIFCFGFLRVQPLAEIIGLKVRKFANYILVSQLLTKCTRVEFSQTCLRPLFCYYHPISKKKRMASNLFCKTENHFPELLFATKKTTGGFPFTPFVKPPGR